MRNADPEPRATLNDRSTSAMRRSAAANSAMHERQSVPARLYWDLTANPNRRNHRSVMTMTVHQFLCLTDNYGVLLHDSATGATAAIDAPDADRRSPRLSERGWTLTDALITHHHADHVQGIPELKAKFPTARSGDRPKRRRASPFSTCSSPKATSRGSAHSRRRSSRRPVTRLGMWPIISTTTKSPFVAILCSRSDAGGRSRRPMR